MFFPVVRFKEFGHRDVFIGISKETLNKSAAAEQRIFCSQPSVRKMGNTYSIPSFSEPCLEVKIFPRQLLPIESALPYMKFSPGKGRVP